MTKIAKLIIIDEATCKIKNLEPNTTRKLIKKFEYEVPGARFTPAVKLGRWDGMVSFFSVGGGTYINLLPEIIPILYDDGYEIDIEDTRDYCEEFEFEPITEDTFIETLWPAKHPLAGQPIRLRDYQVEIVNQFLTDQQSIYVAATGAGKSLICAALSARVEKYGRSIVVVPNKSLVVQTEEDYKNLGLDVGVLFGDRKEYDKTHTICTWQSLDRLVKNTKNYAADVPMDEFLKGVVAVIQDECFHGESLVLTNSGYRKIIDIEIGDTIVNYNEITNEFKLDTVINKYENLSKSLNEKMYELNFDNGRNIRVTGNHKFLTENRGWIRADELTENDEIVHLE